MENLGERLVGDYLRHIKGCDFVDFNVYTKATQGEIDVVGVANAKKQAYICEVVTHLTTGIQYVKNARPDTSDRLIKKFIKDIYYGSQAFPDYAVVYMLWSPVVRHSNGKPEYDQFAHLKRVEQVVKSETGIEIILVLNNDFVDAIDALRAFARVETKELKSPVMRFLQIEEWSRKNLKKILNKKLKHSAHAIEGSRPVSCGLRQRRSINSRVRCVCHVLGVRHDLSGQRSVVNLAPAARFAWLFKQSFFFGREAALDSFYAFNLRKLLG